MTEALARAQQQLAQAREDAELLCVTLMKIALHGRPCPGVPDIHAQTLAAWAEEALSTHRARQWARFNPPAE